MAAHLSRITALESNLDRLTRDAAMTSEVDSVRDEARQLIESHHLDLLNLKAHVWGIGTLRSPRAKGATSPRRGAMLTGFDSSRRARFPKLGQAANIRSYLNSNAERPRNGVPSNGRGCAGLCRQGRWVVCILAPDSSQLAAQCRRRRRCRTECLRCE